MSSLHFISWTSTLITSLIVDKPHFYFSYSMLPLSYLTNRNPQTRSLWSELVTFFGSLWPSFVGEGGCVWAATRTWGRAPFRSSPALQIHGTRSIAGARGGPGPQFFFIKKQFFPIYINFTTCSFFTPISLSFLFISISLVWRGLTATKHRWKNSPRPTIGTYRHSNGVHHCPVRIFVAG